MKKIIITLCSAALVLASCNDDFLEKYPLTDLTEVNAFKEYDNFKAFMNPCYEMFTNTTIRTSINSSYMNAQLDRKSTRLNSSHANISYAVFCLKKKKNHKANCGFQKNAVPHCP